jgi:hypothetical protein
VTLSLEDAVSNFGKAATAKLKAPSIVGEPEDQLRAPFERLLRDLAGVAGIAPDHVVSVGETALAEQHTRPDYAVAIKGALTGFVELKAPGKGADPRKFKAHDKLQWSRLQSLPNLLYTDGNEFSLWQDGQLVGAVVRLSGDVESAGAKLAPGPGLLSLFEAFFSWQPIPPTSARDLAHTSARLCRLLRDEVSEELERNAGGLASLAADWRKLLFPDATSKEFADGYAQAVTFGLLMARARGISVKTDLHTVAEELKKSNTLIGAALQLLTGQETRKALATSLGTMERVLDVVDWPKLTKGKPDSWLYFYEEFLDVYDSELRKKTGSYYTPPEVVQSMVSLVDQALQGEGFGIGAGLNSPAVTIADPAVGTGTYVLGLIRRIASKVSAADGPGAVPSAIEAALSRIVAFELQLGPYAVAQLRILAEVATLTGAPPKTPLRMFVTDTLANPEDDEGWIPGLFAPIAQQRKDANRVKREVPITVVLGNPPYKERAKGRGAWVEGQTKKEEKTALLNDWMPPAAWGVGAHAKHLRNLYIYFWRWASWKVFEQLPEHRRGIVCYITVAGFLSGPGFERMRAELRKSCDAIWVIDCSPEGYQPAASSRVFQGVQQPVCIVLAAKWSVSAKQTPARVRWRTLPPGHRQQKFELLNSLSLTDGSWLDCPQDWRAPFLPAATQEWGAFPSLEDFFNYSGAGVMPGRTWVIAPDETSLKQRWGRLISAKPDEKGQLFHPHLVKGRPGDRHVNRVVTTGLAGFPVREKTIASEQGQPTAPIPYGFRSFDRQWILPDARLINRPNPGLWGMRSDKQIFLTAFTEESPTSGPALTVTALIPDLHHYKGSFGGRAFPLWADAKATVSNIRTELLNTLEQHYGHEVSPEDLLAYIAGIAAHPGYIQRFRDHLTTPGLRIPLTAEPALFGEVAALGRRVVWLHTFGERMVDPAQGRPAGPPRLSLDERPVMPQDGAIPATESDMPDSIEYNEAARTLHIGTGCIRNVPPGVWRYEVSGKQVLVQWFSYRKKTRARPIIGDRRTPSSLGNIQPSAWLPEYTTELLNVLNVLGGLVALEATQATLLEAVCAGPLISTSLLGQGGVLVHEVPVAPIAAAPAGQGQLFS